MRCGLVPVFMKQQEDETASYASIDEIRELMLAIGLDPEALELSERMERAMHDSLSKAAPTLRKYVRSALELERSALHGPEPTGPVSKLGGVPWLKPDDEWPKCKCCSRPLAFFAQLNLGALRGSVELPPSSPPIGIFPELSSSSGMLQLWGCADGYRIYEYGDRQDEYGDRQGDCQDATYENPFGGTEFIRLVPQEELGSGQDGIPTPPSGVPVLPTELLSAVSVRTELGLEDEEFWSDFMPELWEEDQFYEWLDGAMTGSLKRDWVGGWAVWLQEPRYPECPKCREPMTNVLFNWNCEHIDEPAIVTQCPKCPDQMAFIWDID